MKKINTGWVALVLMSTGLACAVDANAQACERVAPVTGDKVRLDLGTFDSFWFQSLELRVQSFAEYAVAQTNEGGTFCGVARVLISGNLVLGRMGRNQILVQADAAMKPGTRLQLAEFVLDPGSSVPICVQGGLPDTCQWSAFLFRSATVANR